MTNTSMDDSILGRVVHRFIAALEASQPGPGTDAWFVDVGQRVRHAINDAEDARRDLEHLLRGARDGLLAGDNEISVAAKRLRVATDVLMTTLYEIHYELDALGVEP